METPTTIGDTMGATVKSSGKSKKTETKAPGPTLTSILELEESFNRLKLAVMEVPSEDAEDTGIFSYGIPSDIQKRIVGFVNSGYSLRVTSGKRISIHMRETNNQKEQLEDYLRDLQHSYEFKYEIHTDFASMNISLTEDYNIIKFPYYGSPLNFESREHIGTRHAIGTIGGGVMSCITPTERHWFIATNSHVVNKVRETYKHKTEAEINDFVCVTWAPDESQNYVALYEHRLQDNLLYSFYDNIATQVAGKERTYYMDFALKEITVAVENEAKLIKSLSTNKSYFCPSIPDIKVKKPTLPLTIDTLMNTIVFKHGQSSKVTEGKIIYYDTLNLDEQSKSYDSIVGIESVNKDRPISSSGDSGSVYVNKDGFPVAMHFMTMAAEPGGLNPNEKQRKTYALAFLLHPVIQKLSEQEGGKQFEFVNLQM